jgi:hypothetical protein
MKTDGYGQLRTYRTMFLISIFSQCGDRLLVHFDPLGFARLLLQPDPYPAAWPRVWGAHSLACIPFMYQGCTNRYVRVTLPGVLSFRGDSPAFGNAFFRDTNVLSSAPRHGGAVIQGFGAG